MRKPDCNASTPMDLCVDVTQIKEEQDPKDLLSPAFARVPRPLLRRATQTSSSSVATLFPTLIRLSGQRRNLPLNRYDRRLRRRRARLHRLSDTHRVGIDALWSRTEAGARPRTARPRWSRIMP